jgi:alkylated DNA repair protein (DNA oxidative demethylase)
MMRVDADRSAKPLTARRLALDDGAWLLAGFAAGTLAAELLHTLDGLLHVSPPRTMLTRTGPMSVAMSNCGTAGWVSDRRGYRYEPIDPQTGGPWPAMPQSFARLARNAAVAAGYKSFVPDACLISQYAPGTRLSLHQDRDERSDAPIVAVSLGVAATFLFGGGARRSPVRRVALAHGDVVVWGGASRLHFHGVAPLAVAQHPLTGERRINLSFRQVW